MLSFPVGVFFKQSDTSPDFLIVITIDSLRDTAKHFSNLGHVKYNRANPVL